MSSTKAAVMIACPKFSFKTPASPNNRKAMPTLVGARAVPAATPVGKTGNPKATVSKVPASKGKTVPKTATMQDFRPTTLQGLR